MSRKLFDASVKTGEYTDREGNTKARYENIGTVFEGERGMFLVMKRTFNPAGVPNPDAKDSIIVGFFEPREEGQRPSQSGRGQGSAPPQSGQQRPAPAQQAASGSDFDDGLPF